MILPLIAGASKGRSLLNPNHPRLFVSGRSEGCGQRWVSVGRSKQQNEKRLLLPLQSGVSDLQRQVAAPLVWASARARRAGRVAQRVLRAAARF